MMPTALQRSSAGRDAAPAVIGGCARCPQARPIAPAARLGRCAACGAIVALPRALSARGGLELAELARIAPGGVLRDRYQLIEVIGEGAHGVSYFAEHRFLNHPCVVKILPHRAVGGVDPAARRLRNEARAGFRVNHPNVVRVLDCDMLDGVWYFAMEYVDGVNLADVLAACRSLPWRQVVYLALDAASGLAAIHRAGLIHRDIKPGNLILGADGRVRVADLGVATFDDEDPTLPSPTRHTGVGTFDYAAPEMFSPQMTTDGRADLYSLGATMYHLLTGRAPHASGSVFEALLDAQHRPADWPADGPSDVPRWLIDGVLRMLAPEPSDRFSTPDAVLEYLRQPLADPPRVETSPVRERLQPRGVAVLPFRNESGTSGDDWLGLALSEHLTRALAQTPGVYVVDAHALSRMMENLAAAQFSPEGRMQEAGRLVGAGSIVEGGFSRDHDTLRVSARVYRSGFLDGAAVGPVSGPLARLVDQQEALLERLRAVLGVSRGSPPISGSATTAVPLAAREKCALAKHAYLRGDYKSAIQFAEEARAGDPNFAEPIQYIGVCLARLGRYTEAAQQHRLQEDLAHRQGDMRLVVEARANLGVMHYFRGEYEAAEHFYRAAAATGQTLGLTAELANIYNNLGFVLFRLRRPADAEQAFRRAIELHRSYGALASLVAPYNGIGNVLLEQGRPDEAAGFYRRALTLAEEIGDRTNMGMSYAHLGRCASLGGRFADAKHDFTLALNALEETHFWNGLSVAYEHIAEMNLQLGNIDEALRCADRRIELARLHENRRIEASAWRQKATALKAAGRVVEADASVVRAAELEKTP